MKKIFNVSVVLLLTVLLGCKHAALVSEENLAINLKDKTKSDNTTPCFTIDDLDCDGITDSLDNCPETYNPNQEDTDGDGIGDACDPTPNGTGGGPGITPTYVSAATYYNNYCVVNGIMDYNCGLAKGIKETLDETPPIFNNTTVYTLTETYYKIDSLTGSTRQVGVRDSCIAGKYDCYRAIATTVSTDSFLLRQANIHWLNGKTGHIDELKASYPNLANYYDGYRSGVIQAFWFYSGDLTVFQMP